jgi:hypothetical protein
VPSASVRAAADKRYSLGPILIMHARTFAAAVGPVVVAEIVIDIVHQLISPTTDFSTFRNVSAITWLVLVLSFVAFPLWAGFRVSRATPWRWWSTLAGASVLLGTLIVNIVSQFWSVSPFDSLWLYASLSTLLAVPFCAVLGFIGGAVHRVWGAYGA